MQPNGYTTLWDVEKNAQLRELWNDSDLPIEQIASLLSARWGITITPHSLHNKAHRLGLKTRSRTLGSIWNDERRWPRLKELREVDGLSFGHIAFRLSWEWGFKVTKNAVLGKFYRECPPRSDEPYKPAPYDFLPGPGECSYPNGHPGEPGYHYCKAPAMRGRPYCEAHHAICWLKPKKRDEERIAA